MWRSGTRRRCAGALVEALRDIVDVLAEADPENKADRYAELGVSLTYHADGRVAVEALLRGVQVRVGGAFAPNAHAASYYALS
jgi:hypothetical protein